MTIDTTYAKRIVSTSTGYVCYLGTIEVGTANTYGQAEKVCAEAFEDFQHIDPATLAMLATLTPTELRTVAEQLLREMDAPAEPRLRCPELPPVAINTLADNSTVYGHFDNDDSHLLARLDTADGWEMCTDENGLDLWHTAYDFKRDDAGKPSGAQNVCEQRRVGAYDHGGRGVGE